MPLNKNEAARIRRVQQALEKVLDALHGAQGQLYPAGLKGYREQINTLIAQADKLQTRIQADLPKATGRKASAQLDIEDFDDDDRGEAA